jgi:hypothetical protein
MLYQLIISHLLFDYGKALTPAMIKDKSIGRPGLPIATHALLHSIGVISILLLNGVDLKFSILLGCFEFITHFGIDVVKGQIENTFKSLKDQKNPYHWHLFQVDQFLHISVKYIISIVAMNQLTLVN